MSTDFSPEMPRLMMVLPILPIAIKAYYHSLGLFCDFEWSGKLTRAMQPADAYHSMSALYVYPEH
jgi:hypothetical protein